MSKESKKFDRKLKQWEIVSFLFAIFDIVAIAFAFLIALWLRFDCNFSSIPEKYLQGYLFSIVPHIVITVALFVLFHLYNSVWKFAGYFEFVRIALVTIATGISNIAIAQVLYNVFVIHDDSRMPISYFVFGTMFQFLFCVGIRFSYRTIQLLRKRNNSDIDYVKPVIIYGAGDAGRLLAKDIAITPQLGEKVVAFIDDNPEMQKRLIDGIKVVGGREDVLKTVADLH
ncbi:MAG: polysaccharide biosynthesis protein, partial [Clostridia bacterium]|nr:polysaccharide biosynthesis protein [Clostridia bacterium]